jgi:hypothetical protein
MSNTANTLKSSTRALEKADTFLLAKGWLEMCCKWHPKCRPVVPGTSWLPTRLIYVEHGEDRTIRLCERADIPLDARYATLSHCWGSHPIYTLTTDRLEMFLKCIPSTELVKTFLDAIQITRQLGLEYLWIDSLCIIQDSDKDWLQEASLMGRVYKNCWCNIAATGFSDGRNGLFAPDPAAIEPVVIQTAWSGAENDRYLCVDTDAWTREVSNAPLNKRAWVFQERIFSPRVLHFTRTQLFWECREKEASECFPNGFPDSIKRMGTKFKNYHTPPSQLELKPLPSIPPLDIWAGIFSVYNGGKLTRRSDKLIAISGLAREMQLLIQDDYHAGLWRGQMETQLLWHVKDTVLAKPKAYQAPSWTWASVDAELFPPAPMIGFQDKVSTLIKIIDVRTIPLDCDNFGRIKDGYIVVQGRLLKALIQVDVSLEQSRPVQARLMVESKTIDEAAMLDSKELEGQERECYCVPVALMCASPVLTLLQGLILEATGIAKGEFRRIGLFNVIDLASMYWLGHPRASPDPAHFLSSDGLGQYEIKIV